MKVTLIDPLVEGIEGTSALDMKTLGISLPKDVYTNGQRRWLNPKDLAFIKKYRAQIRREMRRYGLKFGSVYIVPDEHLENARNALQEIRRDFESERDTFVDSLDIKIRKWADAHPEHADSIRNSALSAGQVRNRIIYSLREYEIEIGTDADGNIVDKAMTAGLEHQLAAEIASLVRDGWRDKAEKKTTRKSLALLDKVMQKVRALSFIAPGMATDLLDMANDVVASLPKKGAIEGKDYLRLEGLFTFLSDPVKLLGGKVQIEDEPEIEQTDSATAASGGGNWVW